MNQKRKYDDIMLNRLANVFSDNIMASHEGDDAGYAFLAQGKKLKVKKRFPQHSQLSSNNSVTTQQGAQPPPAQPNGAHIDDERIKKLEVLYGIAPGISGVGDTPHQAVCAACNDDLPPHEVARCPCSHEYCRQCLERLFTAPLEDNTLWPPSCCGRPVLPEQYQICVFLSAEVVGQYLAKKLEMDTPNRTYCHRAGCNKFIPPARIIGIIGACPQCQAETCTMCKEAAHDGAPCRQAVGDAQMMALAEENGWRQCYSCHSVVETTGGCNHMVCRCGAQFCYSCGAPWESETCHCNLYRAEALVERDELMRMAGMRPIGLGPRAREQDIMNAMDPHYQARRIREMWDDMMALRQRRTEEADRMEDLILEAQAEGHGDLGHAMGLGDGEDVPREVQDLVPGPHDPGYPLDDPVGVMGDYVADMERRVREMREMNRRVSALTHAARPRQPAPEAPVRGNQQPRHNHPLLGRLEGRARLGQFYGGPRRRGNDRTEGRRSGDADTSSGDS